MKSNIIYIKAAPIGISEMFYMTFKSSRIVDCLPDSSIVVHEAVIAASIKSFIYKSVSKEETKRHIIVAGIIDKMRCYEK